MILTYIIFKKHKIQYLFLILLLVCNSIVAQTFKYIQTTNGIEIYEKEKKVLFFQQAPKKLNDKYERAGYVHPLYGLNNEILTDDSPIDHPYHRGIFWAWHQIIQNNKQIADGWTSTNIIFKRPEISINNKAESIALTSNMKWGCLCLKDSVYNIINEHTTITIYKSVNNYRLIDFDISLFPLIRNMFIGGSNDYKGYGGFSLRLKFPKNFEIYAIKGLVNPPKRSIKVGNWVNFVGTFDNAKQTKTGIVVFAYPSPKNKKTKWVLRTNKSMQNIAFPGRKPIKINEDGLSIHYRILIYTDFIAKNQIIQLYNEYTSNKK